MKNTCMMLIAVVLLIPASQARQQALGRRIEKYLPAIQQAVNDASAAGEMSIKVTLPNVPWKEYNDICEYLHLGGYTMARYGENETQALTIKW